MNTQTQQVQYTAFAKSASAMHMYAPMVYRAAHIATPSHSPTREVALGA